MTKSKDANRASEEQYINLFDTDSTLCLVEPAGDGKYREVMRFPPSETQLYVTYDDKTLRMIDAGLWAGPSATSVAGVRNMPWRVGENRDKIYIVSMGVAEALRGRLPQDDSWDLYVIPQGFVEGPESADPAMSFVGCTCCTRLMSLAEMFGHKRPESAAELMGFDPNNPAERKIAEMLMELDGFADDFF